MNFKLWGTSEGLKIPGTVCKILASKFQLKQEEIAQLRLVEQWGKLSELTDSTNENRVVRLIRIYDPTIIRSARLSSPGYRDLKLKQYRAALQFEGHIEKGGAVHLADRRAPKLVFKPINLNHNNVVPKPTN